MRNTAELLTHYAQYHRDRRNITTHLVGVPMIVFGLGVLLSRPTLIWQRVPTTPAWWLFAAVALWYLTRGNWLLGAATSGGIALLLALAHPLGGGGDFQWLACALGFFLVGWMMQLIGHLYEGRRPAFADDLASLLTGPMFVTAELLFAAGYCKPLQMEIERRAGPTMLRDLASPAR